MIPLGPVVARNRTKVSRATVWAYLTDPQLREQWWESLQLDPRLGGAVSSAQRELAGNIDVWVAGHALGFRWRHAGDERDTAVLITLRSQGFHTGFTVTETGFDALEDGAARADVSGRQWGRFVDALAEAHLDEAAVAEAEATARTAVAEREAAAMVVAAAVVTGEITEGADAVVASAADEAVEVEAEPQVGDHLELVTGPVAVVEVPADVVAVKASETAESQLDEDVVPLVLPGPPIGAAAAAAPTAAAADEVDPDEVDPEDAGLADVDTVERDTEGSQEDEDPEDPEEPDFDSLLKGLF